MIEISAPGANGVASLSTVWAVMEAARAGANDATAAARGFLPKVGAAVSVGLHATGFALGYSVAFPAVAVSRLVPASNPIVYGLTDGGRAGLDLARSTLRPAKVPAETPRLAAVPS
jgi:hypothetical protein